jgi:hypothetical protein
MKKTACISHEREPYLSEVIVANNSDLRLFGRKNLKAIFYEKCSFSIYKSL